MIQTFLIMAIRGVRLIFGCSLALGQSTLLSAAGHGVEFTDPFAVLSMLLCYFFLASIVVIVVE